VPEYNKTCGLMPFNGQIHALVATNQGTSCCIHVGAKKQKQMKHLNGQEQIKNSS
jgi:hypothetical protein